LVALDGRAVKTREKLFEMIGEALAERGQEPVRNGDRAGVPVMEYPPFAVFVDESHAISERAQQGFLTMLEKDDRSVMLDGQHMRRIAVVRGSTFILATTKPAELDRALRTRCTEINLDRYTVAEVEGMIMRRTPQLPAEVIRDIARASRITPRIAFEIADDVREELMVSDDPSPAKALARVLKGRGIITYTGLTRNDVRYLQLLDKEKRALGETVIAATLSDIDRQVIADDVEPYLVRMDMMRVTERGRAITAAGKRIVEEFKG
jgi:Holliday junction DNA helicase RuvB